MRTVSVKLCLLAVTALISFNALAIDANEDKRVEALLNSLARHHELIFVRNGDEYKVEAAVDHLKMKYDYAKDDLNTAEDFIKYCASRSSFRQYE